MNNRAIFASGLVLSVILLVGWSLAEEKKELQETPSLETIAAYRNWTKVNADPHTMLPGLAFDCRPLGNVPDKEKTSPHLGKQIVVYVNELGQAAMSREKPKFSTGTIVVKEKLNAKNATEPELLTVMVKRKPGYDAEHGDWEYLTLDGKASKITSRGKLENCRSCHDGQKDTDYLFRFYMTDKDRERLTALHKTSVPH